MKINYLTKLDFIKYLSFSIKWKKLFFQGAFLILPFIMLWWLCPFISSKTIGNDYQQYFISEQMELMFNLKTGSFPLFTPGFAGGHSASALTLGQIFHPISHIAALLPGYWKGYSAEWNTFLKLISLGFAHLILFSFLKRLKVGLIVAFFLSCFTVYNLRMLDLFRFGASLESWTGYIFLCSAIGYYWIDPTPFRKKLYIIGASYWLICSGHPQMMYYGLLGVAGFTLVIPYFIKLMLPEKRLEIKDVFRFWICVGLCCVTGVFLSSAYILPFYFDFLSDHAIRSTPEYAWAIQYNDTLMGTINNFFSPLRSEVNGGFGGTSVFLISLLIPLLPLFRVKVPKVIWLIWSWGFFIFLHMQGDRTPVHYLVWKYLPGASSIRIAGRISLIMPIILMLITAWILKKDTNDTIHPKKKKLMSPPVILSLLSLVLSGGYFLLPESIISNIATYCATSISHPPLWFEPCYFIIGSLIFSLFFFRGVLNHYSKLMEILICVLIFLQLAGVLYYGTWIENKKEPQTFEEIKAWKKKTLDYSMLHAGFTKVLQKHIEKTCVEPFLGTIYSKYLIAKGTDQAYELMTRKRSKYQIVLENYLPEAESYKEERLSNQEFNGLINLNYSSANRLEFNVNVSNVSFFLLAYPYTGHWRARVDGQSVTVYKANGAYNAVLIPAGRHRIEFRYWSESAFIGIIISSATFVIIGILFSIKTLPKPYHYFGLTVTLIIATGVVCIWLLSLYTGKSYNTKYEWRTDPETRQINVAYGKPAWMSSRADSKFFYLISACKAVDGNRSPVTGFCTDKEFEPWWVVDLNQKIAIDSIVIYEGGYYPGVNHRPLYVLTSPDGIKWSHMRIDKISARNGKFALKVENPNPIRYIRISATGTCSLSLDEVEVYPVMEE